MYFLRSNVHEKFRKDMAHSANSSLMAFVASFMVPLAGLFPHVYADSIYPPILMIDQRVQLYIVVQGFNGVGVESTYLCTGGSGTLQVSITQLPQDSGNGRGDSRSGSSSVLCDYRFHQVSVTLVSNTGTFNLGLATVNETLTTPSGNVTGTARVEIEQ